ncbi:MAG: DUF4870 domain-containing protein [Cyclobacteriaceae bacterium]
MAELDMEETTPSEQSGTTEDKTVGIVAYLWWIGLLIAFIMNQNKKSEFGSYHIRQGLGLTIAGIASGLVWVIPILGWIIGFIAWIFLIVLWVMGLINAINGKMKPVPVLGEKFAEWFAGVQ